MREQLQEPAVRPPYHHQQTTRRAQAVAATRGTPPAVVLTGLIVTVMATLLSGAVWMQLT